MLDCAGNFARTGAILVATVLAAGLLIAQPRSTSSADVSSNPSHINSIGMQMQLIPAGSFRMGSPESESGRLQNEDLTKPVSIDRAFFMSAHEVTVEQFREFVDATNYRTESEKDAAGGFGIDFATGRVVQTTGLSWRDPGFPGFDQADDHPVILVSWRDANQFCRWLSDREGLTYRLPTEQEWEYACRAGTTTQYWSGDASDSLRGVANVADLSLDRRMPLGEEIAHFDDGYPFTAPVGSFRANAFGLHDMHGNVWEWCSDVYLDSSSDVPATIITTDGARDEFRSIRGGGWLNGPERNRSAQRVYFEPSFRSCLLSGFRVVLELEDDE